MNTRPIGVFDSGIGGLSCIPPMRKALPSESIIYFGDTARAPYGGRSEEEIIRFSLESAERLISRDAKMLAIACNTISCIAIDDLKHSFPNIPIIGIIDPLAEFLSKEREKLGKIACIATEATVKSGALVKRLKESGMKIIMKACPSFVPIIEAGLCESPEAEKAVKSELEDFLAVNRPDSLVLGCTHFPFMRKTIERLYPEIRLIDPAESLALKVKNYLTKEDMLAPRGNAAAYEFNASKITKTFEKAVKRAAEL